MGVANKCFEILENRSDEVRNESHLGLLPGGHPVDVAGSDDGEDDDGEDDDVDDVDDEDDDDYEADDTESEDDVDIDEDSDDDGTDASKSRAAARLRLREILFYDDKVAVFKARHGRL